jgi:hypothetical protein
MSPNPLEILKKGFTEFSGTIKNRKNKLTEKLSRGEAILSRTVMHELYFHFLYLYLSCVLLQSVM